MDPPHPLNSSNFAFPKLLNLRPAAAAAYCAQNVDIALRVLPRGGFRGKHQTSLRAVILNAKSAI